MTTTGPLEIKVIFDAGARRRPGRAAAAALPRSRGESVRGWAVLALMNLIAASAFYYAVWWRVDRELYMILMMKTPVTMDLEAAGSIFVPSAEPRSAVRREPVADSPPGQFAPATAQWLIPTTAYTWLTLATAATCALGLACGAAALRAGGAHWRRFGWVASTLTFVALAGGAYLVWRRFGAAYPPNHLRVGMGGLVLFSTMLGIALGVGARKASRVAAYAILVAAVATSVALFLGAKCGAIEPIYATATALATAFALHSAYGWLLLVAAWKLSR